VVENVRNAVGLKWIPDRRLFFLLRQAQAGSTVYVWMQRVPLYHLETGAEFLELPLGRPQDWAPAIWPCSCGLMWNFEG
jgi:hypothetical protein